SLGGTVCGKSARTDLWGSGEVTNRSTRTNKRAGAGATKMNAGIPACGLGKIHRGGGQKRLFD
ncbi:hypothetical protein DMA11_24990, partial [Marinilabiliaceae bacterium JC017]